MSCNTDRDGIRPSCWERPTVFARPRWMRDLFPALAVSTGLALPMPRGRASGHRTARYEGPRDPIRRAARPELTPGRLRALNVAWAAACAA